MNILLDERARPVSLVSFFILPPRQTSLEQYASEYRKLVWNLRRSVAKGILRPLVTRTPILDARPLIGHLFNDDYWVGKLIMLFYSDDSTAFTPAMIERWSEILRLARYDYETYLRNPSLSHGHIREMRKAGVASTAIDDATCASIVTLGLILSALPDMSSATLLSNLDRIDFELMIYVLEKQSQVQKSKC